MTRQFPGCMGFAAAGEDDGWGVFFDTSGAGIF